MVAALSEMLTVHMVHFDYVLAHELDKLDISILQFKSKLTLRQVLLLA